MRTYVATFHTHLAAMMTLHTLKSHGIKGWLKPVPRRLSSSCGTCVYYESEEPQLSLMDKDVEGVYEAIGDAFTCLFTAE